MSDEFDMQGLKAVLTAAGLDPQEPHDMRLFTRELDEPNISFAEAAKRAGERKQRARQGSGFDQLNSYFEALRHEAQSKPAGQSNGVSQPGELSGSQMLQNAIRDQLRKGK